MDKKASNIGKLESEGWTRRFVTDEPRLKEAVELYENSGFEVHLEPLPKKADCESCLGDGQEAECRICFEGFEDRYRIIFTRPRRRGFDTAD